MSRLHFIVTAEHRFENVSVKNPPKDICFGIAWNLRKSGAAEKVISPFKWSLIKTEDVYKLRDTRSEVRGISWGEYHSAIEYASWKEYDHAMTVNELVEANEKLANIEQALKKIYDINMHGYKDNKNMKIGPINNIFTKELPFIDVCAECGKACCPNKPRT